MVSESKVRVFFRNVLMWMLFTAFLIIGLASMFVSFLSGLIMLLAACIFVPQINRTIKDRTNITVTPGGRAIVVIVCFGIFIYTSSKAMEADQVQRTAQEALIAEQARKENREYVTANENTILTKINDLASKQDYAAAIAFGGKYNNAGSIKIDQAMTKVSAQKGEADKQQRKSSLVASLQSIPKNNFTELASTYTQLAAIDKTYQTDADKYSKLAEQKAQEEKARKTAEAEKAYRQSMGLTWNYSVSEDSMSGKSTRHAYVSSINTVNFKFPYGGAQRATLTIRKHPRWGTSVYISLDKGQFICGYDDCYVRVRFANGKAQRMSASEPSDHSNNLLFISNASSFISQARKSDTVFIEANFYQEGSRVFEFDISDLEWK